MSKNQTLVLGWKLSPQGDPHAWINANPLGGSTFKDELVEVNASGLATNTVIIAQSGSGKSFFLGRLVEELMTQTKARITILDPNSDFRQCAHMVDKEAWTTSSYNNVTRTGWLPTESKPDNFVSKWKKITLGIESNLSLIKDKVLLGSQSCRQIYIPWRQLPAEYIIGSSPLIGAEDVALCHAIIDLTVEFLATIKPPTPFTDSDIIAIASSIFQAKSLEEVLNGTSIRTAPGLLAKLGSGELHATVQDAYYKKLLVDPQCLRQYMAKATSAFELGQFRIRAEIGNPLERLTIIDLASLPDVSVRLSLMSTTIDRLWRKMHAEWSQAMDKPPESDNRVPSFLVVDEAHHAAPREPATPLHRKLVSQFREIATEGRKYAIFLILVTQRPDRIDPIVAGECQNVAVMRLGNPRAIEEAASVFSLDGPSVEALRKARSFDAGRVGLVGRWVQDTPCFAYVAGRRTLEGGRSVRPEAWALK